MKKKIFLRQNRHFSEDLRKKIVRDIESGKASVIAASRAYDVSHQSIYNWINRYSRHLQSGQNLVLQMDSEAYKTKQLEQRIKELEAALGRKQMEVDFLNKMIEIGKEELGIDIKKKFSTPPSNGSESTKDSTPTE